MKNVPTLKWKKKKKKGIKRKVKTKLTEDGLLE